MSKYSSEQAHSNGDLRKYIFKSKYLDKLFLISYNVPARHHSLKTIRVYKAIYFFLWSICTFCNYLKMVYYLIFSHLFYSNGKVKLKIEIIYW